jgi:hypothetical protein
MGLYPTPITEGAVKTRLREAISWVFGFFLPQLIAWGFSEARPPKNTGNFVILGVLSYPSVIGVGFIPVVKDVATAGINPAARPRKKPAPRLRDGAGFGFNNGNTN